MAAWGDYILASDTQDQDEAEGLLEHAQAKSRFLKAFNQHDIHMLAQHLSILEFEEGEIIMQKGQQATWMGILLSGELEASIGDTVVGHTPPGAIVGEVAFFAGGHRRADVKGSIKGHLAFMQAVTPCHAHDASMRHSTSSPCTVPPSRRWPT